MVFKDKRVIIFDLDGTLIDSVPDLANAVNFMLKTLNLDTFEQETIRFWVGNGASVLVKRALPDNYQEHKKALDIFLGYYSKNLAKNTVLYPHVKESLRVLKESGFILVIVTNKPFDFIKPILEALEIDQFFEFYLGGDSLQRKKPDPLPLLEVCKKFNIQTDKAVMIGDSKNDILAAKASNIQSIALSYGYNYGENISTYEPDFIFDDFIDILNPFGVEI